MLVIFIRLVIKTYIFKLSHRWLHFFACLHTYSLLMLVEEIVK